MTLGAMAILKTSPMSHGEYDDAETVAKDAWEIQVAWMKQAV